MAKSFLADTSFWFALYDDRDQRHPDALLLAEEIRNYATIIPWPCLYETLNTRFAKREKWVRNFRAILARSETVCIDDAKYKEDALQDFLNLNARSLSLVDLVIRRMLRKPEIRIDALVTFNAGDFVDVCDQQGIELIGGYSRTGRKRKK